MMSSGVETEARRGRTRNRDEATDDQDTVPEHLRCVICQGEGLCCPERDDVWSFWSLGCRGFRVL